MLSAETASGKYPFACIRTMHEIVSEVEKTTDLYYDISLKDEFVDDAESIAASACLTALKLKSTAIVCLSTSGRTATLISRFRPKAKIFAFTHNYDSLHGLELVWGLQTFAIKPYKSSEEALSQIEDLLLRYNLVKTGDTLVVTMGLPVAERAKTNTLRVYHVYRSRKVLDQFDLPVRCREI